MTFTLLSLFPEIFRGYFEHSIMKRSLQKGLVRYRTVNIRDFAHDRHRTCDDAPYGGGAGMVLKPEPLAEAVRSVRGPRSTVICLSPSGELFTQSLARRLAREEELILVCGRYEGVDQRFIDRYVDREICVGDYVLSSGEVAALVVIDTVYRLLEGVLSPDSLSEESFGAGSGLLEYPHYTRPEVFEGMRVPEVLLSGNHAAIQAWRRRKSLEKTRTYRPELCWNWQGEEHGFDQSSRDAPDQG